MYQTKKSNDINLQEQEFPWNSKQKGLILSAFFWGYVMTPILGGWLGSKFGGDHVSIFLNLSTLVGKTFDFVEILGIWFWCGYDISSNSHHTFGG